MKVATVLGTRPEIIRLSLIIGKLDKCCTHVLVHTGQNYAESLSDIFFRSLRVRKPDYSMSIRVDSFGEQIGKIFAETEKVLSAERPDRLLILGDTNSGLSAFVAKRMGIPVYHMEAGNRCFDDRVPEEVNRRIIDHSSDVLMPYTYRSKENLVREGIAREKIFVIGNPINEVLINFRDSIEGSSVFGNLDLQPHRYFLVTLHRAENVDIESRLKNMTEALELIAAQYNMPIICSLHPRTKSKMEKFGLDLQRSKVRFVTPLGFFDFVALEKKAFCVLSDSGTVQEECSILNVPNVTIRDSTERPETIECGSNVLSGDSPQYILRLVELVTNMKQEWRAPEEYLQTNVSDKVVRILMSKELYKQ